MNVFIIPSWYPSKTDPLPGVFFREQALALANHHKNSKFGISTWGQNDDRLLLWSRDPLRSFAKSFSKPQPASKKFHDNVMEFFNPTYTWSSRFWGGNFEHIINANLSNFQQFETLYGKIDIIHAHVGYPAGYIAKKLSEIHEIPYVITEHMSPFPHEQFLTPRKDLTSQLAEAYRSSSRNICVSHQLMQQLNSFGIANTAVIPNLVDDAFFKIDAGTANHEKFIFFSLGRLVPQKGIDILIKAFARNDINAMLKFGGDGAQKQEYQKLASDLGIENKVIWLGELDKHEVIDEFEKCDAFVLPSRHESMGVVFAEAMASGKPVIATICGGPEEFVCDDCGILVEPEDENGLAHAMDKMIKNHLLYDPLKIRDHCHARFSQRKICAQIMDVYQEITGFDNRI